MELVSSKKNLSKIYSFIGLNDSPLSCDESPVPAKGYKHIFCIVICILFAVWLWLLNPANRVNFDQLNIVTFELTKSHPENFSKDPVFGGDSSGFYPSLYGKFIKVFVDKFGFYGGYRVLQFPLMVLYLLVMYWFLYTITGSVSAALLVALFSSIWHDSMGAAYWGMDRIDTVQPRSFVLIWVPLLLLVAWKFRQSWYLTIVFIIIGLLMNVNPPGALFFAVALWFALLFDGKLTKLRFLELLAAGFGLIVGALPFIYAHISARMKGGACLSLYDTQLFMEALRYRFARMSSYPIPLSTVGTVILSFSFPLLLGIAGWAVRGKKRNSFDKCLLVFFLFTAIGFVVLQYLMQKISFAFDKAPPIVNIHRGQKYAYLILFIYSTVFIRFFLMKIGKLERRVILTVAAILLILLPVITFAKLNSNPGSRWQKNTQEFATLMQGKRIDADWYSGIVGPVAQWVSQNTPPDSLILFGHYNMPVFRVYAKRSMVGAMADGGVALYNGPEKMIQWYKTMQVLEHINDRYDANVVAELAETTGSDYIVLASNLPAIPGWKTVATGRYWNVYMPSSK